MTKPVADWQTKALLARQAEYTDELVRAVEQVRAVFAEVLAPGERFRRELMLTKATPSVTKRNAGDVVGELKRSGDVVAGRERGAPLYWRETPPGIDPV